MKGREMKMLISIPIFFVLLSGASYADEFGEYVGKVVTEWLDDDDRSMKLLEEFTYVDQHGFSWVAPKGSIINGASIPKFAWSIMGGPYVGKYRKAAVIHDASCDLKIRKWEDVHIAFYNAMLASDVWLTKAKTMYAAVYFFGPRWIITIEEVSNKENVEVMVSSIKSGFTKNSVFDVKIQDHYAVMPGFDGTTVTPTGKKEISVTVTPPPQKMNENDFKKLRKQIEEENLSLEQIRNYSFSKKINFKN
jgi:hypothetical protein